MLLNGIRTSTDRPTDHNSPIRGQRWRAIDSMLYRVMADVLVTGSTGAAPWWLSVPSSAAAVRGVRSHSSCCCMPLSQRSTHSTASAASASVYAVVHCYHQTVSSECTSTVSFRHNLVDARSFKFVHWHTGQ